MKLHTNFMTRWNFILQINNYIFHVFEYKIHQMVNQAANINIR